MPDFRRGTRASYPTEGGITSDPCHSESIVCIGTLGERSASRSLIRSGCEHGVQLGERLAPALLTGGRQILREPLADLDSRPSVGLVVELDSDLRLERLEALGELAGDVHGAIEQLAHDDLRKVDLDVDPNAGIGRKDLRPSQVAARAHVELDLVARQ